MYAVLLAIHSFTRWLVLFSLLFALYRSYKGWLRNKIFTPFDNRVRHTTATIVHIQLLVGIWLYSISPLIHYFISNYTSAVREREIRFFGMEHSVMMFIAVIFITIGSAKARRKVMNKQNLERWRFGFPLACLLFFFLFHGNFHQWQAGLISELFELNVPFLNLV